MAKTQAQQGIGAFYNGEYERDSFGAGEGTVSPGGQISCNYPYILFIQTKHSQVYSTDRAKCPKPLRGPGPGPDRKPGVISRAKLNCMQSIFWGSATGAGKGSSRFALLLLQLPPLQLAASGYPAQNKIAHNLYSRSLAASREA